MTPSRRAFLLGGIGAAGLALAGCGLPDGVPDNGPGPMVSDTFHSSYRHQDVGYAISYPPGHKPGEQLPVLVTLHGRGGDHTTAFHRSLYLDHYQAQAVQQGVRAFVVTAVDGGDHEYWHPRDDGDPAGMVEHEFIPLLGRHGLQVDRVALLGWSMGGYGALYLASRMGAGKVCAMVAESPAIWHHSRQSVEGAFDDAADWHDATIWHQQQALRGIAVRIDCGADDGFAPVTRDLRASLHPTPAGGIEPGGHDSSYWRTQAPAQFRWLARHFT
ncbi:MAG TPA: alpha/beta hydrolase-fold protein [Jatrophihabitantaceae bacterium]